MGTPAVVGNRVYITIEAGVALALDKDTSEVLWTFVIGSPSDSAPAVTESAVYFGSRNHRVLAAGYQIIIATNDRRLFAFNSDTGAVAWEYDLVNTNLSTAPAIACGVLYLPTHDGRLLALR